MLYVAFFISTVSRECCDCFSGTVELDGRSYVMLFDSGRIIMTCFSCLPAALSVVQALAWLVKNAALAEGVADDDVLDF